jgi:hypothetical protein
MKMQVHEGSDASARLSARGGLAAHGLDVMPIRIKHKGPMIIGIILWPRARRTIVAASGRKRRRIKGVDGRMIWCGKGHMCSRHHRIANANPEERPLSHAISRSTLTIRIKPLDAERFNA